MTAILTGLRWHLKGILIVISLLSKGIELLLKHVPVVSFEDYLFSSRAHFVFLGFYISWCFVFELFVHSRQYSSFRCTLCKISLPLSGLSCSLIYYFSDSSEVLGFPEIPFTACWPYFLKDQVPIQKGLTSAYFFFTMKYLSLLVFSFVI